MRGRAVTIARREIIDESKPGIYHITSRCVRRAFLCGKDSYSGQDYEHRKAWIRERILFLTEVFAIDMLGYVVMCNHMHLIPYIRPDLAKLWSPNEVAERWLRVVSTHHRADGEEASPSEEDIAAIVRDPQRVEELRKRLSSISCFMAKLNEYISRRANKEEDLGGRFWEGRFKSTHLSDTAAVVACMVYVDLNPVRAKIATSIEDSENTSGQDRLVAELGRKQVSEYDLRQQKGEALTEPQQALLAEARRRAERARFLVSLSDSPLGTDSPLGRFSESTYLELLDWTGRQVREGKRGVIPDHILPILESLDVNTERWVKTVEHYGSLFHRLVACAEEMAKAARSKGRSWFHGVRACREFYANDTQQA
jgi:REP element-mobilizing transposase RayT